jgi:hypothetical protein
MFGNRYKQFVELACRSSTNAVQCASDQLLCHNLFSHSCAAWTPADLTKQPCRCVNTRTSSAALKPPRIQWVFLGPPGVGKGTYSTRVAVALGVAHIAAGDLVRFEMKTGSALGNQVLLRITLLFGPLLLYLM